SDPDVRPRRLTPASGPGPSCRAVRSSPGEVGSWRLGGPCPMGGFVAGGRVAARDAPPVRADSEAPAVSSGGHGRRVRPPALGEQQCSRGGDQHGGEPVHAEGGGGGAVPRSEEHTSELQSRENLV